MSFVTELLKGTSLKNSYFFILCLFIVQVSNGLTKNGLHKDLNNDKASSLSLTHGFIENKSQDKYLNGEIATAVKYTYSQQGIRVLLTTNGIAYQFSKFTKDKSAMELYRADMVLEGANMNAEITASENLPGQLIFREGENEFYAGHFSKVTYSNIYPNIDWVVYLKDGKVKYDFIVKPGADPACIKMKFNHFDELTKELEGGFSGTTPFGKIAEEKPYTYQGDENVSSDFLVNGKYVSFNLGEYDHSKTLVIDPAITWASYFGSTGTERSHAIAIDNSGNIYLAGSTDSPSGIAVGGFQTSYTGNTHGFLAKFNSAGVLQWSTYYGGHINSYTVGVACDPSGNVYLSGSTAYTTGIFSGGHQSTFAGGSLDAFLVKFNSSGSRLWGTYYGGVSQDDGTAVCTDASGNVYLVGTACSVSSIASGGHQTTFGGGVRDAYIVKFNSSGVRQWASYYGGSGYDFGISCCTDASGDVYLSGNTFSPADIASSGFQSTLGGSLNSPDMFLVKFSASGTRLWGTYYGGGGYEDATSCCTDGNGNVFLAGMSESGGMSLTGHQNTYYGGLPDGMLVKFNSLGVRQWATYYGAFGFDAVFSCHADNVGNVYVAGAAQATVNIASLGFQNSHSGNFDAFVAKFNSSGARLWGSYFGSAGTETAVAICKDGSGDIYFAGTTDYTANIAQGGSQNTYGGGSSDAFLVKLCDSPTTPTAVTGNTVICSGVGQQYVGSAVNTATAYIWSFPNNLTGTSTNNSVTLVGQIPGSTAVSTIGIASQNSCGQSIQNVITVTINASPTVAINSGSICAGDSFTLNATGASSFLLSGGSYVVSPPSTSSYTLSGVSNAGCVSINTAVATVSVYALPTVAVTGGSICIGSSFTLSPSGAVNYTYLNGGPVVNPSSSTSYSIKGASFEGCQASLTAVANVTVMSPAIISINSGSICLGQSFSLVPQGALSYSITGNQWLVSPTISSSYTINGVGPGPCPALVPAVAIVSVMPIPSITVTASSQSVCSGSSVVLTATGTGNILWDSLYVGNQHITSPTASHVYTVSGKNSFGCVGLLSYTLTVLNLPTVQASSSPPVICAGQAAGLSATGANSYSWSNNYNGSTQNVSPLTNSLYVVTGIGTNGCANSSTVNVLVETAPVLILSVKNQTICAGESIVLSAAGAAHYNWSVGSTASLVTISPVGDTLLFVTGSSPAGCSSSDTVHLRVAECTGIKEFNTLKNVSLYPNPSQSELFLMGELEYPLHIKIIGMNGSLLHEANMESQEGIDVAHLPVGLYLLEVRVDQVQVRYFKFAKE